MTEIKLQAEITATEQQQALPLGENLGHQHLDSMNMINGLAESGIPIEDKVGVAQSLDVLRDEFGIDDDVFEQPKPKLVLTAIADKLNRVNKSETTHVKKAGELEYVADLVMLAVGPQTTYAEQYISSMETLGVSDEKAKAVHDKFTQPEVTKDMDKFLRGEAFDPLRARLGITDEMPYEVKVLSIDSEGGVQSYGLIPYVDFGEEQLSHEEFSSRVSENNFRGEYVKGLKANGKAFNAGLGREGTFAPAWVSTFSDGSVFLCLALPTAEKVLYTDEERSSYFSEDDRLRDLAMVEHEFTHTQKSLLLDEHIGLGIALEELRAEHFSGNKHGYLEIKKLFRGIGVMHDFNVESNFEKGDKPYDEERFLTEISINMGLDGLLDVLTVIPSNYATDENASPYLKAIVDHNGGSLSAHFQKLYQKAKLKHGSDKVEARFDEYVDKIRDTLKDNDGLSVESFLHYGSPEALAKIGSENFRRRYPDESDNYDYDNHRMFEK